MSRAAAYFATLLTLVGDRLGDRRDERGATAVEYGLMVGLIAVVIIVAVIALGENLLDMFTDVNTALTGEGTEG
ncbi:Flp family type IVb pilin [Bogoriella caseilytica]|uniref:Pilus assembly protein Flp/PilA n=1 Tax=Bogoriella caseilytica TaxID=56055 RepID=A0A3N2BDB3_9MICO|nr:Flp family type IVb pilin [Bogoriella caseilytica]ROR73241.1 pilus assembly protein Flp/PilA [Bogoriella caseilytica]